MARTSAAVAARTASRSRWKSRSHSTDRPYRPRYSEPSARKAPYGPMEAATNSGPATPSASARRRAAVRQLHRPPQQAGGVLVADPARREPLERRLVARGRRDPGAGAVEGEVRGLDPVGGVREEAGGPQPRRRGPRPSPRAGSRGRRRARSGSRCGARRGTGRGPSGDGATGRRRSARSSSRRGAGGSGAAVRPSGVTRVEQPREREPSPEPRDRHDHHPADADGEADEPRVGARGPGRPVLLWAHGALAGTPGHGLRMPGAVPGARYLHLPTPRCRRTQSVPWDPCILDAIRLRTNSTSACQAADSGARAQPLRPPAAGIR